MTCEGAATSSVTDRAGRDYWEARWENTPLADPVDPRAIPLWDDPTRAFHQLFADVFAALPTEPMCLLEIGAANSAWLPYFAREFGFTVVGLDYSPSGCNQEREVLQRAGVRGTVVCADAFDPPPNMLSAFDIVVSFGVVEHFEEVCRTVEAFAAYVRPGGLLITTIPNLTGAVGRVQRLLNRPVFDVHVPLDTDALTVAHHAAGLTVHRCDYFTAMNFSVLNLTGIDERSLSGGAKTKLRRLLVRISELAWLLDRRGASLPSTRFFSPYIVCIASRPRAAQG